jgi:hypothetical protein
MTMSTKDYFRLYPNPQNITMDSLVCCQLLCCEVLPQVHTNPLSAYQFFRTFHLPSCQKCQNMNIVHIKTFYQDSHGILILISQTTETY